MCPDSVMGIIQLVINKHFEMGCVHELAQLRCRGQPLNIFEKYAFLLPSPERLSGRLDTHTHTHTHNQSILD